MLRDREITVRMNRQNKGEEAPAEEGLSFEEKADVVVKVLENIGTKLFAGLCLYILLDTRRQVMVEEAKRDRPY